MIGSSPVRLEPSWDRVAHCPGDTMTHRTLAQRKKADTTPHSPSLAPVETGASMAYDLEINSIVSKIALAKMKIAGIEADIEALNFKNAMIDADTAMSDTRTAHDEYREAVMDRKTALAEFSRTLEDMAIASGASKKDAAKLQNAVEAVPLIEQAIGLAGKVRDAIRIPPYSESSGLGAAVAENRADFVAHVAVMKGYRENVALHQQKWARRLSAVNKFM
jgi:hypothetical protein